MSCQRMSPRSDRRADDNAKMNEYLYRRVDIEDVVCAHLLALERAVGFWWCLVGNGSVHLQGIIID